MPQRAPGSVQAPNWKGLLAAAGLLAGGVGCVERARIGFEPDPDNEGPRATIDDPAQPEVTVPAGPIYSISGRVADIDGVDTVYFELFGVPEQFQPHVPSEFDDTVRFALPIHTAGRTGTTLTVLVFGTDREGIRGDTATRRIAIQ